MPGRLAILSNVRLVSTLLALAALGVAVGWHGGYDAGAQWTFAGLAGAAALLAVASAPGRALELVTEPVIVVLLALGWLAAISAWWTIGAPADAYRAGALAAGYGALALATAILAPGAPRIAFVIGVVAAVTALLGLLSVSLHSHEFASRIAARWQADGTFGYAPSLARVQIYALPLFLTVMLRARAGKAVLAAACAALGVGVVVLAANRMAVALALLVVGIPVLAPGRTVAAARAKVTAAAVLLAAAALGFHLVLGARSPKHSGGELGRTLLLVLIVAGTAAAWPVVRRYANPSRRPARVGGRPGAKLAGVAVLACLAAVVAVVSSGALGERFGTRTDFTHGRGRLFRISYETFASRPIEGYGGGSYLRATLSRQEGRKRLTRFGHDLPLELAVELGVFGLLLGIALYLAAARAFWRAYRAEAPDRPGRSPPGSSAAWLLGPAVAVFLVVNLVDWSWHLAGVGAVISLALGGLIAAGRPAHFSKVRTK